MYLIVWEFTVPAEHHSAFIAKYRGDGEWARLFGHSPDWKGTELIGNGDTRGHFLTIDRWESKEGWESFRASYAAEYLALDLACGVTPVRLPSRNMLWHVLSLVMAGMAATPPVSSSAITASAIDLRRRVCCETGMSWAAGCVQADHLRVSQKPTPASEPSRPRKMSNRL